MHSLRKPTILLVMTSMVWGQACSHLGGRVSPLGDPKEIGSFRASEPDLPKVTDPELETIPVEINDLVEKWITYFQGRGRPHMERYLSRSTRYSKLMKKILRQNGLPEDLIYIALIESGFSHKATSRAAAVGYWQFIRGTGKRYGLEINALVDERRDPVLATQAAAEYFKGLYSVFGSWYLAMASYNVGENRVKREVMNHYTRDFWELAKKRRFPRETINYVPKFIAAKLIGNNPEQYGFTNIAYQEPIEFEKIAIEKPINLKAMAQNMGLDYDDFKMLNPKFKGEIAPLKNGVLELRVPVGQTSMALAAAEKSIVDKVRYIADGLETQIYRVRPGDSLYRIARKYRTTVAWLRDVNDIKSTRRLRIGQKLEVPARAVAQAPTRSRVSAEDRSAAVKNAELNINGNTYYVVQPGDTLSHIADDYDSSVVELRQMNSLRRGSILRVGMRLRVPKMGQLPDAPEGVVTASHSSAHVVRPGENLTVIARRYGVSVWDLKKANNLSNRSILRVGVRLVIPNKRGGNSSARKPKVHIVRRGENLTTIAKKYEVGLDQIKRKNNIRRGNLLYVGTKILIPTASAID